MDSARVAGLASLLFAGVALFATEYNVASLIQFVLLPVAYSLPPISQTSATTDTTKLATVAICALQCIVFLACLLSKSHIGNDERAGVLSLISIGLVADAMFHQLKVMSADPSKVSAVYELF